MNELRQQVHALCQAVTALTQAYNESQPRDERGRWSAGGGGGGNATENAEQSIYLSPIENAVVIDDSGIVIFQKAGDQNSVQFSQDEIQKFNNATFTHNHPMGSSFSVSDIDFALRTGLKEMRAVGEVNGVRLRYKIAPEWNRVGRSGRLIADLVKNTISKIEQPLLSSISEQVRRGEIKNPNDAEYVYHHELWKGVDQALREFNVKLNYSMEAW